MADSMCGHYGALLGCSDDSDMQCHYDELCSVEEKSDNDIRALSMALDALFKLVVDLNGRVKVLEGKQS